MRDIRTAVAYHEAGHAVMAMACGFRVKSLSLEPVNGSAGRAVWEAPVEPTFDDRRRSVFILSAGMAADCVHAKLTKLPEETSIEGHDGDRFQAFHHQVELGEEEAFDFYCHVARKFLERDDVWRFVEVLAKTLLITDGIDGEALLRQLEVDCPKLPNDQLARPGILYALAKETDHQGLAY